MKKYVLILAALCAILIALPVGAAKPVSAAATLTINQSSPSLGDTVTFSYTTDKHESNLRIQLVCYQGDRDGNGFPDAVYGADQLANTGFLLGSVGSEWLVYGGPANCHAVLYKNQGQYQFFAALDFGAGG